MLIIYTVCSICVCLLSPVNREFLLICLFMLHEEIIQSCVCGLKNVFDKCMRLNYSPLIMPGYKTYPDKISSLSGVLVKSYY